MQFNSSFLPSLIEFNLSLLRRGTPSVDPGKWKAYIKISIVVPEWLRSVLIVE